LKKPVVLLKINLFKGIRIRTAFCPLVPALLSNNQCKKFLIRLSIQYQIAGSVGLFTLLWFVISPTTYFSRTYFKFKDQSNKTKDKSVKHRIFI